MNTHAEHSAGTVLRDPVCGMNVDPSDGKPTAEHDGHTFHFCSARCRDEFVDAPDSFVLATDPVCGMSVDRATAGHTHSHAGALHYFCSSKCKDKFTAAPDEYLGDRSEPEPMPEGTIYTPCIPKLSRSAQGPVRNAAWRWKRRACRPPTRDRTRSLSISNDALPSALYSPCRC